jgi:hypothetical protein
MKYIGNKQGLKLPFLNRLEVNMSFNLSFDFDFILFWFTLL